MAVRASRSTLVATMVLGLGASLVAAQEGGLSIPDHGVGRAVEDRQLKDRSDSFPEGTRVYFWTRVLGGEAGDRIQHVWLHGGEEVVSVGLSIGGSHWRTWSHKTLHPGSAGKWTVEARDAEGNVIVRDEFLCGMPGTEAPAEPSESSAGQG